MEEQRERIRLSEHLERRSSTAPEGGHYWGQIQDRADWAYEDLEPRIVDCLERLGNPTQVREIGLWAKRDSAATSYEIVDVVSHPPQAVDETACVKEIAQAYVDAVGSPPWDDFKTYMATFVHRGRFDGQCDEEQSMAACSPVGAPSLSMEATGDMGDCDTQWVEAIQNTMRAQNDCWSAARFDDHLRRFEGVPIESRAVLFGEAMIADGEATIVLRYNQPWVEKIADCIVENLGEAAMPEAADSEYCRSRLSNRAVSFWHRPTFSYVYDGDANARE